MYNEIKMFIILLIILLIHFSSGHLDLSLFPKQLGKIYKAEWGYCGSALHCCCSFCYYFINYACPTCFSFYFIPLASYIIVLQGHAQIGEGVKWWGAPGDPRSAFQFPGYQVKQHKCGNWWNLNECMQYVCSWILLFIHLFCICNYSASLVFQ